MNTLEILRGAEATEARIEYFRGKAPYFPDFYHEEESDGRGVVAHHISAIVRHNHEGTYYARHHYVTHIGSFQDAMKQFTQQVYIDIQFGTINPEFVRPNGRPVDPADNLQVSEKERLLG